MENMGKQKLVDKTIKPQEVGALQTLAGLSVAQALQNRLGAYLIGGYKGQSTFVDLDKLVNEPLVNVEQQHILGILNGGVDGHDLITVGIGLGSPIGTAQVDSITVPAGQVWYLNALHMFLEADATAGLVGNWSCSLWPDRAAVPNPAGQPFHAVGVPCAAAGPDVDNWDEFGPWTTVLAVTNKVPLLRLPAGSVITFSVVTNTAGATADLECTLALHGFIGKRLVA